MTTIIETERLILRPLRESDLEQLVLVLNNINITRNTARIPFPYTRADAEAFLEIMQHVEPGSLRRMITRKDRGDIVCGDIGYEADTTNSGADLGFWLAEADWRQGYGTEAARTMTDHAFEVAQHRAVFAGYRIGNEASRRILERLGFRATVEVMTFSKGAGTEVPVIRMELTRAAWLKTMSRRVS